MSSPRFNSVQCVCVWLRCNYFPNWLFVQTGIEIHACQISMGLDWMPSSGQSSSGSNSSCSTSTSSSSCGSSGSSSGSNSCSSSSRSTEVVLVAVILLPTILIQYHYWVLVVVVLLMWAKAAAVVCGWDRSTLVRASPKLYCCLQVAKLCGHQTIESQMVTSGVICGGPKLIINVFSLFAMIQQIAERTI